MFNESEQKTKKLRYFVLRRSSLWQFKNSVYLKQCISIPPPTHTQPTQHTYTLQLGHKHNKVIPASLLTQSHSWYFTANYPKLQNGIPGSNKNISIAFRFADLFTWVVFSDQCQYFPMENQICRVTKIWCAGFSIQRGGSEKHPRKKSPFWTTPPMLGNKIPINPVIFSWMFPFSLLLL